MKKITLYIILKYTPDMIIKLFCDIILIADTRPTIVEKVRYFSLVVSTMTPVVWITESLSGWFIINKQFATFLICCVTFNIVIGAWYHHRMGTFRWEELLKKNITMIIILLFAYTMLEMLRITVGSNFAADGFRIVIQLSSLLWPCSKSLKNLYILSNKQFPPAFIMERLYNFEKSGDLNDLFPNEPKQ